MPRPLPDAREALNGRTVAVLGGSGFVGRHVCAALAAAGARLVRISRTARSGIRDGSTVVCLDPTVEGPRRLADVLAEARVEVLVNASGIVWGGSEQMTVANAGVVSLIVEALSDLVERPRLIQIGSAYEYGPAPHGTSTPEDHPAAPTSIYGRSKLHGTRTVLRAVAEHRLEAVVLRLSVAIGPGAPSRSLSGLVADHLAEGRPEIRLAPLRAYRDVVDIRDAADAVTAAARAPIDLVTGATINIGSGRATPMRELVDLLISVSGRPLRVVEESSARPVRADAPWQRLDISRARRCLGWSPRRTLEESLRDLLASVGVRDGPARCSSGGERGGTWTLGGPASAVHR